MSTSDASTDVSRSDGARRLGPAVTFATTEHFNLQTARALTVSEANGRASIYLAALSGNLIRWPSSGRCPGLARRSTRTRSR